jgi:mRNA interferase RelE/StbE
VRICFHPDVYKQLQQLPRAAFVAALNAIVGLVGEPRPAGVRKLVGSESDWRTRIGEYRIVYEIDEKAEVLTVMRVAHRRDVYR